MREFLFGFAMFWGMGLGIFAIGWVCVSMQMKLFPGTSFDPGIFLGMVIGFATMLIAVVILLCVLTRTTP